MTALLDAPMILVADDEPDIVTLVMLHLVRAGYRVITAVDGADALAQAEQYLPQLVVLDVMMPKFTGIEVARMLRAAPTTRYMPVILISAGLPDRLVVPTEADAFISKPFGSVEIPGMVAELLASPPRGHRGDPAPPTPAADAGA